jgi:2-hydroxychromene-2-carboxylate isomerase
VSLPAVPPVFFYDLGDPECYLAAEQITSALGVVAEWEPVLAEQLGVPACPADPDGVSVRAAALGLQPVRWPAGWPFDTKRAMLAATYAKRTGRAVSFSLAAFRQAFAAGRDLSQLDTVLIAAAACEMHPSAVIKALDLRSVAEALDGATSRATAAEVRELPAIQIEGRLFTGPRALEAAAAEVGASAG